MKNFTEKYERLFESNTDWINDFSKISLHASGAHNLDILLKENRDWSFTIQTKDRSAAKDLIRDLNENHAYDFQIDSYGKGIVNVTSKLFESLDDEDDLEEDDDEKDEDKVSDDDMDDNDDYMNVELDLVNPEGDIDYLGDSPMSGDDLEFGKINDFKSFKDKKNLDGVLDSDIGMAFSQISSIKNSMDDIESALEQQDDLPAWVAHKLTLASTYIEEIHKILR